MNIRPASPPDFADIARVHAASWKDVYRGVLSDEFLDGRADDELLASWRRADISEDDCVLVAEENGDLLGFIAVWCKPNPFIDNLHVAPGRRSQGLGERLIRAAADILFERGHGTAYLYVMEQNLRARSFYERLGGMVAGKEEKVFFGDKALNLKIEWKDLSPLRSQGA